MPSFETVLQEKPVIVLDIGSVYSRIGFSGEPHPRFIIPTEIESCKDVLKTTDTSLYDQTCSFFTKIFYKYLSASPKDRRICIVESVLTPISIRECFGKVLFCHFEALSVLFLPTHLVAVSTLGLAKETALVIDMGYRETTVLPVCSGVQVLKCWEAQPLAAESIHEEIKKSLILNGAREEILSERVIEDIKVRTCFVTKQTRADAFKAKEPVKACPDVDYPVDGLDVIKIPGQLRETAFEVLFPEDNDRLGLPYIILDAILKCPVDVRKDLAENILLIGGTANVPGLAARLKSELLRLINSDFYKDRLFISEVKFHRAPSNANFTAWLGGSIYAATEFIANALTKENYLKNPTIPDWINYDDPAMLRTQG